VLLAAAQSRQQPVDSGVEERIEVNRVLIDFLLLDKQNRTVPDLKVEELRLSLGGKPLEVRSLDRDCPAGWAEEPEAGGAVTRPEQLRTIQPPRIVLVFDYSHMSEIGQTFERALEMLDRLAVGNEEHMVISMGRIVRVEVPLTKDLGEVRWGLQRMRNDPDLYAGYNQRVTEYPFFGQTQVLFDLLERWPGRKSVVLFSGPLRPDEFLHDADYKQLSALSASTRTALYPVDSAGMRTPDDPLVSPLGGPPGLRRLANETGGRMSADSNDIGLAYARARRDIACTYTVGFEDVRQKFDKQRRLTIAVKGRDGVRVVYPEFYVKRSEEKRAQSLRRTVIQAPHMFESDQMQAELFVMGLDSYNSWKALLAMEMRVPRDELQPVGENWELRGLVRKPNGTIVRSFRRIVKMPAAADVAGDEHLLKPYHKLKLPAGRFVASAILLDPNGGQPRSANRSTELARIPQESPFLVGPVLGRSADEDAQANKGKDGPYFAPLIVAAAKQGEVLDVLLQVCYVGEEDPRNLGGIDRRISTLNGDASQAFESRPVKLSGRGFVRCQSMLDKIPTMGLAPGHYEFTAQSASAGRVAAEFEILPATRE
jgi:VWFA-related protein